MKRGGLRFILFLLVALPLFAAVDETTPARDPAQRIDEEYTKKIKEYTTETFLLSPLVDYLPASSGVPTPKAVLGDVAGAPGKLPYATRPTCTATCGCWKARARG
jgi:hypothetical protein